jgi:hypothetical protein
VAHAQDLVPGAYTPGPVGFNVRHRQLQPWRRGFDPALPLEDGRATIWTWSLGLNRTLNIGGRYSSVGLGMPFLHGHLDGILLGQLQAATLSGQGDLAGRIAVNLHGAPAMSRQEFAKYRASTVLGVSLVVTAPVGRYNYSHYVNIGANRWSFKPELRLLRRRGRWTFEGNLATSFYTDNTKVAAGLATWCPAHRSRTRQYVNPNEATTPTSFRSASGFGGALSNVSYTLNEMKKSFQTSRLRLESNCNRWRPQLLRLG